MTSPLSILILLLLTLLSIIYNSSAFSSSPMSSSQSTTQYPRPIHPGGFSLPPLVEDKLPIVTTASLNYNGENSNDDLLQTSILLIKPPDMESLWEWYAYTKRQTDSDPSWGRIWPTALSLSRFVIRALNDDSNDGGNDSSSSSLMKDAMHALQTTSHVVEVGCGLGVAGLTYASTIISTTTTAATKTHSCVAMKETGVINSDNQHQSHERRRTITFLDKEPYALHCVMSSCATNGVVTGSIVPPSTEITNSNSGITARAAIDDWSLPITTTTSETNTNSQIKNICYQDLHLPNNEDSIVLASDILYEPSTMKSLATKLQSLVNPINGGYVLIADPVKERTIGCRDSFVDSVKELNGSIDIIPLPELNGMRMIGGMLLEGDMDIDGTLATTVLIVVHFKGRLE